PPRPQGRTPIPRLVAPAIAYIGSGMLERIVQHPQAPNLYWALADLPRPFIDLRPAIQGERLMFYCMFPGLTAVADDPNAGALPPEKLERYRQRLGEYDLLRGNLVKDALPSLARLFPALGNASARVDTPDATHLGMGLDHQHQSA